MNALEIAKLFHDTYERLAPEFGYETRQETKEFDQNSSNGKLMQAVCMGVAARLLVANERIVFDAGFQTCLRYGDNHRHYHGEQADKVFQKEMEVIVLSGVRRRISV